MENTPSKIAGDIVIAALGAGLLKHVSQAATIAAAFKTVHSAVLTATIEDNNAGQSNPSK